MTAPNSGQNSRKMPKGRPFVKGDPRINRKGAPPRGQSWQETIKRLTDLTREEAIEYVGADTKLGRTLKELPPGVPIKDAMVLAAIISFGREPGARMLSTLMERADGKLAQPITGADEGPLEVLVRYATSRDPAAEPSQGPAEDQE